MSRRPGARSPKHRGEQREPSGRAGTPTPRPAGGRYSLGLGTRLGHEGEADRVALRVLGTSPSAAAGLPPPTGPSRPAPGGRLPEAARRPAEELLGFDFSRVNVDTAGGEAEREGAHAVTRGDTVHFAPGRFRPDHPLGRALIAHELTHVAQQRAVPRRRSGGGADLLGTPERHREGIARFRSERDGTTLEASHAALGDPLVATTPAPRGLRQRCDGSRTKEEAPPKSEQKERPAPEEGPQPAPPVENLPLDLGEYELRPPEGLPPEPYPPKDLKLPDPSLDLPVRDPLPQPKLSLEDPTVLEMKRWIDEQIQYRTKQIKDRKKYYKDRNWALPANEGKIARYENFIKRLKAVRKDLDAALPPALTGKALGNPKLATARMREISDVLTLANVVVNEAGTSNDTAKLAVAHAYLNRAGGTVREPKGAEISHYKELPKRWKGFNDTERLIFLESFVPSLRAARSRLDFDPTTGTDPTGGATHWVSPVGLPDYDASKHAENRYSRTEGAAKDKAFPNWARNPAQDAEQVRKMREAGQVGPDYAEVQVTGVPREQFLFYRDVR